MYNGLYDITLIAEETNTGCRDTLHKSDIIYCAGGAGCSHTAQINEGGPITACPGEMVVLTANESGIYQYQWQKDGVNISGGTGFIISQYYPQYDRYDRKWLKDNRGMWFLLFSDGTLKYYLSDEVKGKFDLSTWNNPWKLIGPNHFTIVGVKATDTSKYRCVVSNAGSTTSNEATLTVQP